MNKMTVGLFEYILRSEDKSCPDIRWSTAGSRAESLREKALMGVRLDTFRAYASKLFPKQVKIVLKTSPGSFIHQISLTKPLTKKLVEN